jgi:toxin ParE1/3/4
MPLEIRHTEQARRDLREIWHYIERSDAIAADRQLRRIANKIVQISQVPEMGRLRPELSESLRSFTEGRYIIFYELEEAVLRIVRVMHNARDITAEMFDD